jgi:lysophospholipase L1-like esterase
VKWLGQISYELYLIMYPTIYFIQRWRPVNNTAYLALIEAGIMLVAATLLHLAVRPSALGPWKGKGKWTALLRVAPWLVAAAIAAGAFALVQAPADADDLDQLQSELEENAAHSGETAPTPSPDLDGMFEETDEEWPEATPPDPHTDPATVTCVGDSVMLGALPALQQTMPGCVVDAKESRQAAEAIGILQNLDAQGKLGSVVVIALGTNGPFSVEFGQSVIDWLGPDRQVYWVTAYGATLRWQEESNSTIRAIAEQNENVSLIDWAGIAPEHPEWFYSDGIHLQQAGQQGYADFVAREIGAIG